MMTNPSPSEQVQAADEAPRLSRAHRLLAWVEDWFTLIAAICIFGLMLLGIVQVLGRQFFDRPVAGYIDFVELSIATFAFLGIAYCQREGGHVRMDLFVKMAPGRLHWFMELAGVVLALGLIATLTWFSWDHFLRAYESGDSTIDLELPVWPSKLLVPVSFALLCLRLIIQVFGYLRLMGRPDAEPVAVPRILSAEEIAAHEIEEAGGRG